MRKIIIFLGVVLSVLFVSCDRCLEHSDKDLIIPETAEQYRQLLIGEGYPHAFQTDVAYMKLMDDDIEIWYGSKDKEQTSDVQAMKGVFTWQRDLEEEMNSMDGAYPARYKNILGCNLIINDRERIEGHEEDVNLLVAQALTLRAYNYFCLVNWYAKPYDKSTADSDPGVCVWLDTKPSMERLYRESVAKVYELIHDDITQALELFKNASVPDNKFEITREAALLLASRVALYQENWVDVKKYGEQVLNVVPSLYDLKGGEITFGETSFSFIDPLKNPEILFNFGDLRTSYKYIYSIKGNTAGPFFQVSRFSDDALLKLFDMDNDLRMKAFFGEEGYQYEPIKFSRSPSSGTGEAWRVAEVYLNLAEAYVRDENEPDLGRAVELINEIRKNRIVGYQDVRAEDYDVTTFLPVIYEERRKELCFEETHRWWDLRRQGMPELKHVLISRGGVEETFMLECGDMGYVLEIPRKEREYNTAMELNRRPERRSVETNIE